MAETLRRHPRWRKLLKLLLWLGFCGLCCLIALEILLRLLLSSAAPAQDDFLVPSDALGVHYTLRPNYDREGHVRTDARSLRRRDGSSEGADWTILFVGDSVLFGGAVPYEENVSYRLEEALARKLDASVAVWNAGVPGFNSEQEAAWMRVKAPEVRPDLILVQFCMNDYLPPPVLATADGSLDVTRFVGEADFSLRGLLYRSKAIVFLKEKFKDLQKIHPEWFPKGMHYLHYIHRGAGWAACKKAFQEMQSIADANGARLAIILFPMEPQLRIPDSEPQQDLRAFCEDEGILVLDLFDRFEERWRDGLFIERSHRLGTVDRVHLTARGHELAADCIADFVLQSSCLVDSKD